MAFYQRKHNVSLPGRRTSLTETPLWEDPSDEDALKPATTPLTFQKQRPFAVDRIQKKDIRRPELESQKKPALGNERYCPLNASSTSARTIPTLMPGNRNKYALPQIPLAASNAPNSPREPPHSKPSLNNLPWYDLSTSGYNNGYNSQDISYSENDSDSEEGRPQPTALASKKTNIPASLVSSFRDVSQGWKPSRVSLASSLDDLKQLERRGTKFSSSTSCSLTSPHSSKGSDHSDYQFQRKRTFDYFQGSGPDGSGGRGDPHSEESTPAEVPLAKRSKCSSTSDLTASELTAVKRQQRRFSSSTLDSETIDCEPEDRTVDSPHNTSAFASLFRQPDPSPSSQEPKKPRARPSSNLGCVYVIHDADADHVKIGISRSAKKRQSDLRRKCRKYRLTLEWHTDDSIPWDQLQRLEKIIHWDLAQFNRRSKCHCGVMHTEWFDVEIREAKRTVELWLRYQRTRLEVTTVDLERLRAGFPKEEGHTWLDIRTTNHVKRYEYWHWKLFGEVYDEAFCEE